MTGVTAESFHFTVTDLTTQSVSQALQCRKDRHYQ